MSHDQLTTDFDSGALDRLRRFGGDQLLREMIGLFLAHAPTRVALARQALAAADATAVRSALHALKSSAGQLGAVHLQALCGEGERAARTGDLEVATRIVSALEAEYSRVQAWLEGEREAA